MKSEAIKPILKKTPTKSKTPQSNFADKPPAFKTYSCPYLNPGQEVPVFQPDKKINFTLNYPDEIHNKSNLVRRTSKGIKQEDEGKDSSGVTFISGSWQNDEGSGLMREEVVMATDERRKSLPYSPAQPEGSFSIGNTPYQEGIDDSVKNNGSKSSNDSSHDNAKNLGDSENKTEKNDKKDNDRDDDKDEKVASCSGDEDIDSYFNEYASVVRTTLSTENFSNSSKNSLTSIPEVEKESGDNGRAPLNNAIKGNKSPLALRNLKMSRSTSMLRRLVQSRHDFVQNKSMSEDLSAEDSRHKQQPLLDADATTLDNSQHIKFGEKFEKLIH